MREVGLLRVETKRDARGKRRGGKGQGSERSRSTAGRNKAGRAGKREKKWGEQGEGREQKKACE